MSSGAAALWPPPGINARVLDLEDMARILIAFLGPSANRTLRTESRRPAAGDLAPAYRLDEDTGMVYILD